MKSTQKDYPVFFSARLFDLLEIHPLERATAQSKLQYLRLTKQDIEALTMSEITREGGFCEILQYVQFDFQFGFLLCVFDYNGRCCRAYFINHISQN